MNCRDVVLSHLTAFTVAYRAGLLDISLLLPSSRTSVTTANSSNKNIYILVYFNGSSCVRLTDLHAKVWRLWAGLNSDTRWIIELLSVKFLSFSLSSEFSHQSRLNLAIGEFWIYQSLPLWRRGSYNCSLQISKQFDKLPSLINNFLFTDRCFPKRMYWHLLREELHWNLQELHHNMFAWWWRQRLSPANQVAVFSFRAQIPPIAKRAS